MWRLAGGPETGSKRCSVGRPSPSPPRRMHRTGQRGNPGRHTPPPVSSLLPWGRALPPRQRIERCRPPQFHRAHLLSSASSSGGEYWRAGLATLSGRAVAEASDRQASAPLAPGRWTSTAVPSRRRPTRRSTQSLHSVARSLHPVAQSLRPVALRS